MRGAEAAVDRAQLDLEYTKIIAPLAGRIDRRLISVGNLVQADQTVADDDRLARSRSTSTSMSMSAACSTMRATAREHGSNLQEGGGGARRLWSRIADSTEKPFKGKLDFAENRLDQATGTMRVRARFDNPEFRAAAGPFRPRRSRRARTPTRAFSFPTKPSAPTRTSASSMSLPRTALSRPSRYGSGRGSMATASFARA